jgi:two-component system, NarL family, nitrate/nitrite response regulator NarL
MHRGVLSFTRREVCMARVLIVVGVRLYREGLVQLLSAREDLTVVGADADGCAAAQRLDQTAPDVALVEMGLPDLDAITQALAGRTPMIPLVAMGIADSDRDVLECAERGFAGFVTRDGSIDELVSTIRGAANGELTCSPRTAASLMRRLGALAAELRPTPAVVRLTRREREIAALMREELSNKEIATRLRIEVATVKNHVHNVLDKLQVRRRADAARMLGVRARSS